MKVVNHIPYINSTGVYRNSTVQVYFDRPIEPTTILWNTISVNDTNNFTSVVGDIGPIWSSGINLSGVTSGVAFIPAINLLPNNEYTVYVYGKPNSILAKNGDELKSTYSFNFVTGTGYYDTSGNIGIPDVVIPTDTYTTILSGINLVEQQEIDSFYIHSTYPKNQTPNIDLILSGIEIIFTGTIQSTSTEISNLISMDEEEVL